MADVAAQAVRSHYESLGALYRAAWGDSLHFGVYGPDDDRPRAAAAIERTLADEAGMRPGAHVLDVGCGSGGPALEIAAYAGAHVTGIDLVPEHVERARSEATRRGLANLTRFVEGDATQMPFADACFDHIYAIESAYHVADKPRFYAECARVLRPGGCFVGTDWLCGERHAAGSDGILAEVHRHFATPGLIDLPAVARHLEAAGLVPEVVEDLSALGDVERNWDELGTAAWPRLARAARAAPPEALRTFAHGSRVLARAAESGAFLLGHWRARKPHRPAPAAVRGSRA
jgi:SAM-dependent methyltransferase